MSERADERDARYAEACATFGATIERLARGYEADPDRRRDLVQEMHFALWRSLATFDGRCSLRTWVSRVGHNVGATHVVRARRGGAPVFLSLENAAELSDRYDAASSADRDRTLTRLLELIQSLAPPDRQLMLLYLDGCDAATIAEVVGISPGNAATRIHRIKAVLARHFEDGTTRRKTHAS
jgi:RNA polymerase sigma-70 factor, ECF subfamily